VGWKSKQLENITAKVSINLESDPQPGQKSDIREEFLLRKSGEALEWATQGVVESLSLVVFKERVDVEHGSVGMVGMG